MDAFEIQIRTCLAAGHTTIDIAEALGVDIAVVRAVAGATTEGDRADMLGVLKSIALDRGVKAADRIKAAIYVHDETHGRNDSKAAALFSITPVIDMATRLAESRQRAIPQRAVKLIDVPAMVSEQPQEAHV